MFSLFVNLMLAGLAPLLSSLIPRFVYRQGLSAKANYVMLGISAGLLFAIATLDLIPEAMEMARQGSAEVKGLDSEHNHDSNNKNGNDVTDAAHVRNLEENDERGNEEHDHGHSNDKEDGHDHEHGSGRLALLGLGCGYLVLLLVEQLMSSSGHTHSHGGGGAQLHVNEVDVEHEMGEAKEQLPTSPNELTQDRARLSDSFSTIAFVALTMHCLVDGFVMAGAFQASEEIGTRVAWALIIHKVPDGFVLSALLSATRNGSSFFTTVAFLSSMTPIGGLVGYVFLEGVSKTFVGFTLGFGAGTFLFITASGIVPEILGPEAKGELRKYALGSMVVSYLSFLFVDQVFHAH